MSRKKRKLNGGNRGRLEASSWHMSKDEDRGQGDRQEKKKGEEEEEGGKRKKRRGVASLSVCPSHMLVEVADQ